MLTKQEDGYVCAQAPEPFPDATRFLEVTCDATTFIPIDTSKIKTARSRYLRHPTQGGQVNSTDDPDTYEEDIDALHKAHTGSVRTVTTVQGKDSECTELTGEV